MDIMVFIVGSLALGLWAGWFIAKRKYQRETGIPEGEHKKVLEELIKARAEINNAQGKATSLENQLAEIKQEIIQERENAINYKTQLSEVNANYRNLEEKLVTQKQDMEQLQKKFTLEFENLANKILDEKSTKFTKQNQENLDVLLRPLSIKITEFKKQVEDVYSNEATARASLKGEISKLFELNQQMSKETQNLTLALKGESKTQGNWGEVILKRILEISGLEEGRDFKTQGAFTSEEGKRQLPDVIVNLPDNKHMIIDSKVSLTAYEKYYNESNEEKKQQYLKEHVSSIRTHIKQLSEKNYPSLYQIDAPDFVLMFMPIDPAFGLAFQTDPQLYSSAFESGVIIVSPLSLLATLRTISSVWKKEYQNRNVVEIARLGGALYDKFVSFLEDMKSIGKQLTGTQKTFDDAMNKISNGTGNLISRTEKLKQLGAKATKTLPPDLLSIAQENED